MFNVLVALVGIIIVALTIADIFQSVIVPRPTSRYLRISAYISRAGWQLFRFISYRIDESEQRESVLGTYAPLLLVVLLVYWVASLIFGYGCLFFGLRDELRPVPGFGAALYFAGTSLLTIGYGDIVPAGGPARLAALVAGASGFGVVAIVTTFLFSIFGAYQARETYVVAFANRAGAPPSGVELLKTHAHLQIADSLVMALRESQQWMAALMESHLAYPVLTYFRSTHDGISWIAALGAILDASTLTIAAIEGPNGEAVITQRLGRHVVNDLSNYFGIEGGTEVGVDRGEFDTAYDSLRDAGITLRDRDVAWRDFAAVRATYATRLVAMAQNWRIPPAQWIGDRSLITHHPPFETVASSE